MLQNKHSRALSELRRLSGMRSALPSLPSLAGSSLFRVRRYPCAARSTMTLRAHLTTAPHGLNLCTLTQVYVHVFDLRVSQQFA